MAKQIVYNQDARTKLQAGDRVLFGKYSGSEVKLDGEEFLIMREDEILMRLDASGAGGA